MAILGMILMVVGGIAALVGGIWLLFLAFQEGVLWGLARSCGQTLGNLRCLSYRSRTIMDATWTKARKFRAVFS